MQGTMMLTEQRSYTARNILIYWCELCRFGQLFKPQSALASPVAFDRLSFHLDHLINNAKLEQYVARMSVELFESS